MDTPATRFPKADVVADMLSMAVNTATPIEGVLAAHYPHFDSLAAALVELERRYAARKKADNVVDFDDLLVLWLRLLEEQAEVRERYQRQFQFVLVDEYQDTNKIQADLVDLLAARHHNLMVVGDDSQSIYSWRGANFLNILHFPKRHPNTKIYKIETNYRSTPEILAVANAAIVANQQQFAKELAAQRRAGAKPAVVSCEDGPQQAQFVAQRLLELREEGVNLNQMAVLYRSHFHALELQLELTRRNIPFSITSGIRFFEQAHLKDVTAYLKLVCNPLDEIAFKRLAQLLPGIGAKGAAKLWGLFREHAARERSVAAALTACAPQAPKKAAVPWANFAVLVSQIEHEDVRSHPGCMIRTVLEGGYEDYLKDTYANYQSRLEDLEQLASFAHQFHGLEDFLTQLSLLSNVEAEDDRPANGDAEKVRLTTIHQAKGLEFDVVFVIMLCEGLFPSTRSLERPENVEEERRLFYVAITRARDELYLAYPVTRVTPESGATRLQSPSRFLREIPTELVEEWRLTSLQPLGGQSSVAGWSAGKVE
jgi:DNA helicase-2/ATP-dependent DNA helicase PcrA